MEKTGGFTLVEVLISMVIFTIVMTYGLSFFTQGATHGRLAKQEATALRFLKIAMDRCKSMDYNDVGSVPSPVTFAESGYGSFFVTFTVGNDNNSAVERYRRVRATVRWPDTTGPHSITVETVMAPAYSPPFQTSN